uniref:Deacetylase sirtuin-type domain-containing protein n=1 Tax=Phlebotomus papatasi TaxID=29031 RepID=A0A1B0GML5_PHLPP
MSDQKGNPDKDETTKEQNAQEKPSTSSELLQDVEAIRNYLAEKLNLFAGAVKASSKIAVGYGKLYFCKLLYSPVSGDLKSGIPAEVEIPAPTIVTITFGGLLASVSSSYYFIDNPQPFFTLAKELYPGTFKPTPCHYFVKLLHDKGLLKRHYTQNIDTLERIAGIPGEKMVEAHGTFYTNHCLGCRKSFTMEWMKEEIFADRVPTCAECNGVVKPDIVFFGENLPDAFYTLPAKDFQDCDLLIIMGTSLEVHPFASLPDRVNDSCVRLLVNRELVGNRDSIWSLFSRSAGRMEFGMPESRRDVAWLGDCDDGVQAIADRLGFGDELRDLVKKEHQRIDAETKAAKEEAEKSKI